MIHERNIVLIDVERSKLSSPPTCGTSLDHSSSHSLSINSNNSTKTVSSSSTFSTSTTNTANTTITTAPLKNLRCPRCDSSNTKFCYYNNYNLTQPRHFCKTCRRYWTKGGSLRSVPIGGSCRKNKNAGKSTSAAKKLIKAISPEIGMLKSSHGLLMSGFDHHLVDQYYQPLSQNPSFWSNSRNVNQLMSLLRANQIQNPNPNPNIALSGCVKYNGESSRSSFTSAGTNFPVNASSIGLTSNHYNRNQAQVQASQGVCEVQNTIVPLILGNMSNSPNFSSAIASSGTILEPAPVAMSDMRLWNNLLIFPQLVINSYH